MVKTHNRIIAGALSTLLIGQVVWDSVNDIAYDFKFTTNPGHGLSVDQINKIQKHGPINLKKVVEVNP